ncbi:MAG: hypothetical protein P8M25_14555 [Paracoccaceae bacterium]|nr:hypothetical protein [Paracoccaceae bacterium]
MAVLFQFHLHAFGLVGLKFTSPTPSVSWIAHPTAQPTRRAPGFRGCCSQSLEVMEAVQYIQDSLAHAFVWYWAFQWFDDFSMLGLQGLIICQNKVL